MLRSDAGTRAKDSPVMPLPARAKALPDTVLKELSELLRRSGRANQTTRKALCIEIGIETDTLDFLDLSAPRDFASQLVHRLHETGNVAALRTLCDAIAPGLSGQFAVKLATIKTNIQQLLDPEVIPLLDPEVIPPPISVKPRKQQSQGSPRRGRPVQVIGWKGIDTETLYDERARVKQPDCLVGMGTMDTLPKELAFKNRSFDLIIADIEYLKRYDEEIGCVLDLRSLRHVKFDEQWSKLDPLIASLSENMVSSSDKRLGIPIQFGFMEILIDEDLLTSIVNKQEITYDDFNIFHVLDICRKRGRKVAFWDLYLPTLTHLITTVYSTIIKPGEQLITALNGTVDPHQVLCKLRQVSSSAVEEITTRISRDYKGHVEFLSSGRALTNAFNRTNGRIGIVYGAGSSCILDSNLINSNKINSNKVKIVVPQDFLFVWINCCAVLIGAESDMSTYSSLIHHWLEEESQEKLSCEVDSYKGCPVTNAALEKVRKDITHPAYNTLRKVVSDDGKYNPRYTLSPRILPNAWREWHRCWEEMKMKLIGKK